MQWPGSCIPMKRGGNVFPSVRSIKIVLSYKLTIQVPEEIMKNVTSQIPQVKPVPKKLSDYTEEEVQNFPKVFDYPENLLKKWYQFLIWYVYWEYSAHSAQSSPVSKCGWRKKGVPLLDLPSLRLWARTCNSNIVRLSVNHNYKDDNCFVCCHPLDQSLVFMQWSWGIIAFIHFWRASLLLYIVLRSFGVCPRKNFGDPPPTPPQNLTKVPRVRKSPLTQNNRYSSQRVAIKVQYWLLSIFFGRGGISLVYSGNMPSFECFVEILVVAWVEYIAWVVMNLIVYVWAILRDRCAMAEWIPALHLHWPMIT